MPSKTISLEIDAYNRLKAARRSGESFSQTIRRLTPPLPRGTGADLLEDMKTGQLGRGVNWNRVKGSVAARRRAYRKQRNG